LAEENRRLCHEIAARQIQAQAWQSEKQALESQAQAFQTQVQELESIRRNLERTVAVYQRCLFGSRSEKTDPKELEARIAQAAAEARCYASHWLVKSGEVFFTLAKEVFPECPRGA
jgi:hypothetical protein